MNYDEILGQIKDLTTAFITEAESGKEGRGSKTHALAARKLSLKVANAMKEFRSISIKNDKGEN